MIFLIFPSFPSFFYLKYIKHHKQYIYTYRIYKFQVKKRRKIRDLIFLYKTKKNFLILYYICKLWKNI